MNSFPAENRLKKKFHFKSVFLNGKKFQADRLVIYYQLHSKNNCPKLGIAPSKKYGNAIRRNRFKRLSRESFRALKHQMPSSLQLILSPKRGVGELCLEDFDKALKDFILAQSN